MIVAFGNAPFKPLTELMREDYTAAFTSKVLGGLEAVSHALTLVNDGGSIALTPGVIAREPLATGASVAGCAVAGVCGIP